MLLPSRIIKSYCAEISACLYDCNLSNVAIVFYDVDLIANIKFILFSIYSIQLCFSLLYKYLINKFCTHKGWETIPCKPYVTVNCACLASRT